MNLSRWKKGIAMDSYEAFKNKKIQSDDEFLCGPRKSIKGLLPRFHLSIGQSTALSRRKLRVQAPRSYWQRANDAYAGSRCPSLALERIEVEFELLSYVARPSKYRKKSCRRKPITPGSQFNGVCSEFELTRLARSFRYRPKILKHEWPARWQSFIPDLVSAAKTSETICENCMAILKSILPPTSDIPEAYTMGSTEEQVHIRVLESTEENIASLLVGLEYLINISYVDDTEVFSMSSALSRNVLADMCILV
ncbi:hypothetical protein VNO80_21340 [Phaseolus coccineus]|uniref:Exportin-1/Importin-beta-like domain-containing protein n=1 Tax=Phaseolus coccineus TaxID=3886 RepID=A0AAN9QSZ9_PHACN